MNRALRIGDDLTFRDGALADLCKVYDHLPATEGEWLADRTKTITVRNRGLTLLANGRIRAFISIACSWDTLGISAWPCQLKLDDRPKRWKLHDQLKAEELARSAAKAQKRKPRR